MLHDGGLADDDAGHFGDDLALRLVEFDGGGLWIFDLDVGSLEIFKRGAGAEKTESRGADGEGGTVFEAQFGRGASVELQRRIGVVATGDPTAGIFFDEHLLGQSFGVAENDVAGGIGTDDEGIAVER